MLHENLPFYSIDKYEQKESAKESGQAKHWKAETDIGSRPEYRIYQLNAVIWFRGVSQCNILLHYLPR